MIECHLALYEYASWHLSNWPSLSLCHFGDVQGCCILASLCFCVNSSKDQLPGVLQNERVLASSGLLFQKQDRLIHEEKKSMIQNLPFCRVCMLLPLAAYCAGRSVKSTTLAEQESI